MALLLLVVLPTISATAQPPPKLFEEIDSLDRFPADARAALGENYVPYWEDVIAGGKIAFTDFQTMGGTVIPVPQVRQLWQFYWFADAGPPFRSGVSGGVVVRNLDTFEIIKALKFPTELAKAPVAGGDSNRGDWAHAIDEVHDRLFLVSSNYSSLYEIDLHTFAVKTRELPVFPFNVGAITYDPYQDNVLFLYSGPGSSSAANSSVFLYQLDLSAQQNAQLDAAKPYKIQSCTGPVTSTDSGATTANWEILIAEDYLWIPCQRAGHIGVVVRMRRPSPENPSPQEDYIAGPNYAVLSLADQKARRIFMMSSQGEIWAFDADMVSFLGVVGTVDGVVVQGDNPGIDGTGWGADPETGRVFYLNDRTGFGMVDGRFFPVPQALIDRSRKVVAKARIWSDAKTNRVFVLEGQERAQRPRHYKIFRTTPAPVPPPPPSPDLNTVDVEEQAGVTESRFFSRGSGYGFRAIWAQGWATVIPAPPLGVLCPTCPINQGIGGSRGGFVDREFYLGRVFKAEYDTSSTAASAIGGGADEYSRSEFGLKGEPAGCTSSEGGKPESDTGNPADMGPSKVDCPLPGGELRAFAEGTANSGITVGRARTETTITKLNRGVLAQTTAVAQDITIADFIRIGEVRSIATSLATGRPSRKDMSTHTVAIKGVRIGENLVCEVCTDNTAVARALTTAGGPLRMQFRVGTQDVGGLDLALLRGSPGGALTAVQKSEARQTQDRVLVADTTTDIPGLEMTMFNDNVQWGRARQVYQFAGVSTVANYNIVPLPQFGGAFEDDSSPLLGDDLGDLPGISLTQGGSSGGSDGGDGIVGALRRAVEAIGRGLRLFLANPRQFMLLTTAWGLFGLAPYLARRRRLLDLARAA